ncbi:hypothetical protein B0T10DRAFT_199976 [Thelonectria olida]|uniref:TRP C-terminal domain-containing protein n=1 Tax=Thelonectria olida TaxID=1576542 RepID=A0A9P8VU15_9HYPO|nr:hypothetical protein B0T10DRAFT_199976 [Thelonectria olida]
MSSPSFLCPFLIVTLILSLVPPSLTAYVQYQDCGPLLAASDQHHVSTDPPLHLEGLWVSLDIGDSITQLELRIASSFHDRASCERLLAQNVSIGFTLTAPGGSHHNSGAIADMSCYHAPWVPEGSETTNSWTKALFNVSRPAPLATFQIKVDVRNADGLQVACLTGSLTPSIGPTMYAICLWGPLTIFVVVLIAACWREILSLGRVQEDDENQPSAYGSSRAHLTRIADCLSYVQFIFFSGALSLRYPGFLQPVVSLSSWAALMLRRGIAIRDSGYSGVNDGIYEVNGTLGGTPGLEIMTQVIGAPVTMPTWTNIITLAVVIFFLLFGIIQVGLNLRWTRDWFRDTSFWSLQSSTLDRQKAALWVALRVFLSYFLLPIVAWATYQLDWILLFPKYYTIASSLVICLVLVACWWGLSMRSPQNMGYLIIEHDSTMRTQDLYTLATFALLFARGVAIGGFQAAEKAQLLIFLGCEIVQLGLMTWAWPMTALLTTGSMVIGARLFVLLLDIVMIRGLSTFEARCGVGYVILVFHALVLTALFLVPSIREMIELASPVWQIRSTPTSLQSHARSSQEEQPQIYGLRQLHRRPTTRTNLSIQRRSNFERISISSSSNSTQSPRQSSLESDHTSPEELRTYFRSPRCESPSINLPKRSLQYKSAEPLTICEDGSRSSGQDELEVAPYQLPVPSPSPNVDYSVREADLYYVRPRRISFRQTGAGHSNSRNTTASFAKRIKSWVYWT